MSRVAVTLHSQADRDKVCRWVQKVDAGTRVELKEAKRTDDQNSKFWAMLTEVSQQLLWHGQKLNTEDWKLVFLDALKRELRIVPNITGNGFVNLGRSSSDLTKAEFSDLIEIISAFGAEHGVQFQDDREVAA
jgi:hypothetical protein